MKAILMSLMVVALVGGLVGGGMFAYFSDTETSTGNTFTAGTIDISINPETQIISNGTQQEFKPCEWGYLTITVTNDGQNPADVWKKIDGITGEQGTQSEPEEEAEQGGIILPTVDDFEFDLTVDGQVIISEENAVPLADVVGKYIYLGELAPGASIVVEQSFHLLDTGVPQNGLQGDIAIIDETFEARQVVGNPGTPSPLY
jgi:spore coat-associated protein N